jgi:His/Glu/Gln/Arg/opine family amino acid ABC transporter permease subunit
MLIAFAVYAMADPGHRRDAVLPDPVSARRDAASWDWAYFFHLVPLITQGMLVTAKATVLGFTLAAVLGLIMALGRRSRLRVVRWPVAIVIEFIRSTPLLVQLFFLLALVRASAAIQPHTLGVSRITDPHPWAGRPLCDLLFRGLPRRHQQRCPRASGRRRSP